MSSTGERRDDRRISAASRSRQLALSAGVLHEAAQGGIARAAAILLEKFAADASAAALQQADRLLEQGDGEGFQLWLCIADACNEQSSGGCEPRDKFGSNNAA